MTNPTHLKGLAEREVILDAIYRVCLGCDTNDAELFLSAFIKNDFSFARNDEVHQGREAVIQNVFTPVSKLETQHVISNVRIDVEEDADSGHAITYMTAQHHLPGEAMDPLKTGLYGGTTNFVDLVRDDDGDWKVKKWVMRITWIQGDVSIVGLPKE